MSDIINIHLLLTTLTGINFVLCTWGLHTRCVRRTLDRWRYLYCTARLPPAGAATSTTARDKRVQNTPPCWEIFVIAFLGLRLNLRTNEFFYETQLSFANTWTFCLEFYTATVLQKKTSWNLILNCYVCRAENIKNNQNKVLSFCRSGNCFGKLFSYTMDE